MKIILFACTQNAGRSQIAAAIFNKLVDPTKAKALSAGTKPAKEIHKNVILVLQQSGIDIKHEVPKPLTKELASKASMLVTMGCEESCPYVPGLRLEKWDIEDVEGKSMEKTFEIQKKIEKQVRELIQREFA